MASPSRSTIMSIAGTSQMNGGARSTWSPLIPSIVPPSGKRGGRAIASFLIRACSLRLGSKGSLVERSSTSSTAMNRPRPRTSPTLGWLPKRSPSRRDRCAPQEALQLNALQMRGLIPFDNLPVLYVLGRYTVGQTSRPADLLLFLGAEMPAFRHWMVCAFGQQDSLHDRGSVAGRACACRIREQPPPAEWDGGIGKSGSGRGRETRSRSLRTGNRRRRYVA